MWLLHYGATINEMHQKQYDNSLGKLWSCTPVDISQTKLEFNVGSGTGCNLSDVDADYCNC